MYTCDMDNLTVEIYLWQADIWRACGARMETALVMMDEQGRIPKDIFHEAFRGAIEIGCVRGSEISRNFKVDKSASTRWAAETGWAAPNPPTRRVVLEYIRDKSKVEMDRYLQKVADAQSRA